MNILKFYKILKWIYFLIIILFMLDVFSKFEIKNQFVKSFIYFGILVETPIFIIWNSIEIIRNNKKIIEIFIPIIVLIGILIIGPNEIIFSSAAWKTETILYQNEHLEFKKVESQLQNTGLRINHRTKEIIYLTKIFMIVDHVEPNINERIEWLKVNKNVNEMESK